MKRARIRAIALLLIGAVPAAAAAEPTGKHVFDRNCVHCHAPGMEHPGTHQLTVTRGQDKGVLAERNDLVAEYVRYVVRHGLRSMPGFYPSDLTEVQLEALTAYLVLRHATNP